MQICAGLVLSMTFRRMRTCDCGKIIMNVIVRRLYEPTPPTTHPCKPAECTTLLGGVPTASVTVPTATVKDRRIIRNSVAFF